MTNYKFQTYSKISAGGADHRIRYDWCIFMDESDEIISKVSYIKYYLHPTFPDPERLVNTAQNKFTLYSNGWGIFPIHIEIVFKDGSIEKTSHYLSLKKDNWPSSLLNRENTDPDLIEIYDIIDSSEYHWRKASTVFSKSKTPKSNILKSLKKLEELNLIRRAHFRSIDNETLYGVTKKVGNEPR